MSTSSPSSSRAAPLRPGARVAVVAPSGAFEPARLEAGMALISSWGLQPVPAAHLGARFRYTAGTAAERALDLRSALTDPEIDAIWFARGGYGTAQLLDAAPWTALGGRPLIGFSDATAAFARLSRQGLAGGLHAPVLQSLADLADAPSQAALRALLLEGVAPNLPGAQVAGPDRAVAGPLVGGNLCVLASLCGTPDQLDARGKIVLLEDIGEPPYKVDRMLSQLRQAGCLRGALGLALGTFTRCDPAADAGYSLLDVILDVLDGLDLPVVAGLPVGHGPENHPWWVGAPHRLDAGGLWPLPAGLEA